MVSESNQDAYKRIQQWPNWPFPVLIIYGQKASGKTHLSHIWKAKSEAIFVSKEELYAENLEQIIQQHNAFIIEDIQYIHDEAALFHFYNQVVEQKKHLLLTSHKHPNHLGIRLPDLLSRLNAAMHSALELPDEALLRVLLAKQFSDRQLKVSMDTIEYMAHRMDRSFASVQAMVERIDQAALKEKRNITIPFIKTLF